MEEIDLLKLNYSRVLVIQEVEPKETITGTTVLLLTLLHPLRIILARKSRRMAKKQHRAANPERLKVVKKKGQVQVVMTRPTILMVEPEPKDALSVRKLVIETAKFNVTTAYSTEEAGELLRKFPQLDCLVMIAEMPGCEELSKFAKSVNPATPVILLSANRTARCKFAEHHISSHEPEALLDLLRSLFGDPRKAA